MRLSPSARSLACVAGAVITGACWIPAARSGYHLGYAIAGRRTFIQTCPQYLHLAYCWTDDWRFKPGLQLSHSEWSASKWWFRPKHHFAGFGADASDWGGAAGIPVIHARSVTVPYWFLLLIFLAGAIKSGTAAARERKFKRGGLCPHCGYDLRATPDRCPECGATPDNLQTSAVTGACADGQ